VAFIGAAAAATTTATTTTTTAAAAAAAVVQVGSGEVRGERKKRRNKHAYDSGK
jgi:hypothetical protein